MVVLWEHSRSLLSKRERKEQPARHSQCACCRSLFLLMASLLFFSVLCERRAPLFVLNKQSAHVTSFQKKAVQSRDLTLQYLRWLFILSAWLVNCRSLNLLKFEIKSNVRDEMNLALIQIKPNQLVGHRIFVSDCTQRITRWNYDRICLFF